MARILIVGCGYVGGALAEGLVSQDHEVFGLRRDPTGLPAGVVGLAGDVSEPGGLGALPDGLDSVVYAVGAKQREEAAYRRAYLDGLGHVIRALVDEGQNPSRFVFTSSTSVYGQARGEWVDESSPTHPRGFPGEIMLSAERILRGSRFPSTVLRLGGIYGPGRTRLIDRVRAGAPAERSEAPSFTNRIHRDDAAGAIAHILDLADPEPTYLGVDREPADSGEILDWIAEQIGVERRPLSEESPASEAPASGRRCSSQALADSGYRFLYPSYREGYGGLMKTRAAGAA